MEENIVVIMLRNAETGFLDKELATITLATDGGLINLTAEAAEAGYTVRAKLTTQRDVSNWEFNAIYDYYDTDIYANQAACAELEDCENPTWALSFPWDGDADALTQALNTLLAAHVAELDSVYEAISGLRAEYE